MRYFAELAYNGAGYQGWQKQKNEAPTLQEEIERALSTLINHPTPIVGCGRTDTGVHAQQYFIHFDTQKKIEDSLLHRINKYLPNQILIKRFIPVSQEAHARFDATHRAYEYKICTWKDPFNIQTKYYYPSARWIDTQKMHEAAQILKEYSSFYTFCKSNTDVKTMDCTLFDAHWKFEEREWTFHIAANRFLRGMIRLIVGMCLNVGRGQLQLEEVHEALQKQKRLHKSLSVPPQGLYLKDIRYDFIDQA